MTALGVKRRRWCADGTWPLILKAGAPAVERMRRAWRRKMGG
jgi:hypothetical protein